MSRSWSWTEWLNWTGVITHNTHSIVVAGCADGKTKSDRDAWAGSCLRIFFLLLLALSLYSLSLMDCYDCALLPSAAPDAAALAATPKLLASNRRNGRWEKWQLTSDEIIWVDLFYFIFFFCFCFPSSSARPSDSLSHRRHNEKPDEWLNHSLPKPNGVAISRCVAYLLNGKRLLCRTEWAYGRLCIYPMRWRHLNVSPLSGLRHSATSTICLSCTMYVPLLFRFPIFFGPEKCSARLSRAYSILFTFYSQIFIPFSSCTYRTSQVRACVCVCRCGGRSMCGKNDGNGRRMGERKKILNNSLIRWIVARTLHREKAKVEKWVEKRNKAALSHNCLIYLYTKRLPTLLWMPPFRAHTHNAFYILGAYFLCSFPR